MVGLMFGRVSAISLVLSGLLVGCSSFSLPATVSPSPVILVDDLVNVTVLRSILTEVAAQSGGEIRFLKMAVSKDYFEMEMLSPHHPGKIDVYERSTRSEGHLRRTPMDLGAPEAEQMARSAIPLSEVCLEALPDLLKRLGERASQMGEISPAHFVIARAEDGRVLWTLSQEGSKKNAELEATPGGKIVKFSLH